VKRSPLLIPLLAALALLAFAALASHAFAIGLVTQSGARLVLSGGGGGSETISWTAITDPALDGYRVYYGTSSGNYLQNPGEGIDVGTATSYDASALSGTYYFIVKWYDEFGTESPPSNELQKALP
jgi:hypothetical protein